MANQPIKISASRVKTLCQCSHLFYLQEFQKLPQRRWAKTSIGSATHAILEFLLAPKRHKKLEQIILNGFNIDNYPNVTRYLRFYNENKESIEPYSAKEIGDLVNVGFLGIRKYFLDSKGQFKIPKYYTEKRFQLTIGKLVISGFIDLLISLDDKTAVIIDFKSQGQKFKKADLPENIQALIYQMAVKEEMGLDSHTEFILLRHGPTKQTPDKHLQITPGASPPQLNGLKVYLSSLYEQVNGGFGLQESLVAPCKDWGFCKNVCTYFNEFQYQSVRKKLDNTLVKNFMLDEKVKVCDDEFIEIRVSKACPVAKRD